MGAAQTTLRECAGVGGGAVGGGASAQDPATTQRLSLALRRKLGRGATYNLKLLVRGDMSTGKSSLVRRLQGLPFQADLPPTREITTGHIDWSAPDCEDIVKVEVWDVCDTAKVPQAQAQSSGRLSLEHGRGALDADSIDVFRDAHAVVYVFDPRKRWTLEYVTRQFAAVPARLPILVLANFADLVMDPDAPEAPDTVTLDELQQAADAEAKRGKGRTVLVGRASMQDCFGLDALYDFLQLPYCVAKEQALARAQEALAARQAHAEEDLRASLASQEYSEHRHRLMLLRDGPHGAPAPPHAHRGAHEGGHGGVMGLLALDEPE